MKAVAEGVETREQLESLQKYLTGARCGAIF
jgi:EAL domain-containing protein (putative c-di-GMP-specific phosphodiesterase class I)